MKFRLDPKNLGQILSQLRQKSGLSQAKISKLCQVNSPQYISNIERGQCLPSLKILKTMLSEYKVSHQDKVQLIDLFIQSAQTELKDIFKLDINLSQEIEKQEACSPTSISESNHIAPLNSTAHMQVAGSYKF